MVSCSRDRPKGRASATGGLFCEVCSLFSNVTRCKNVSATNRLWQTLSDNPATCATSCVVASRGNNIVGPDSIRQLVKNGTLNDDTLVFFPYKTEQGRRHLGWHGTHRRWAECKHEFAGGELSQEHRSSRTEKRAQLKVWHEGDVQPSDIKQGLLGDCYLMAACASIALLPPAYLVHDLIIDESDVGLFGVKFYFAGRWMSVVIDDWFPCIICGGVLRPCFAQPSSDGALWTCIIEKAFAKLMGSFEAIIGGEAVDAQNYLCAGDIETRELNGEASLQDSVATEDNPASSSTQRKREKPMQQGVKQDAAEQIWLELCDRVPLPRDRSASSIAIDGGQHTGAAAFFSCAVASSKTSAAASSGLNAQHQYSILGAIELVSSGERIIELRDPHGKCEWNGAFCPTDTRWTSAVKREIFGSSRQSVPESGCAFMRWVDFRSFFDEIGICSAFPQAQAQGVVRRESVLGRFDAHSSGGKHGLDTFKFNPAFSLHMLAGRSSQGKRRAASNERRVRVKVTLSQPDTRPIKRSDVAGGGAHGHALPWEDMYLYCLTASTYQRLTAPRTLARGTESSKRNIRGGASRLSGMLPSQRPTQPVEPSDPYLPDWVREISPTLRLRRRLGQAELDLDPQEHYVLVACPWGPGVSYTADSERSTTNGRTSIGGLGNGWDFCITLHASAEVQLSPFESDRSAELPGTEQRQLMQSLRPRQACCFICERGFETGEAHYEVPEGHTHLQCHEDYRERTARRCLECGKAVLGRYRQLEEDDPNALALRAKLNAAHGFEATIDWKHPLVVHSDNGCYDRYRERTAPRCAVCGGSVLSKYYEVDKDGGDAKLIIHAEGDCYQQYQEATAERCLICKLPVLGSFYDVQKDSKQGKVHADGHCHKRWLESVAPRCADCRKPIMGSSYQVGVHGARVQVHAEGHCLARWKARQEAGRHTHNRAAPDDDY